MHADCYTELIGTQLHTDKLVLVEQEILSTGLKGCFRVLIDLLVVGFKGRKVSIFSMKKQCVSSAIGVCRMYVEGQCTIPIRYNIVVFHRIVI